MFPLPRGAIWQLLFLFCVALYINGVRSEGRVVCYYTNWSVYRPGTAKFNPQNINPYLCTHLIYAFGGFTKDNQMKPFDKYQDIEQGGYAKFTGLKTYNKQLKTMIAIGGWNEASSRFSPLVANPERRQKFIKNILKFLRQNHFDGIDLDWEYPAHREGGKSRDRDNYAQLVQELRAEFEREAEKTGRPRLLVTMAVPAGIEYIEKGYDIPKLNKYLDWFNVLTYDFHSSHEPSVNHHAPLYSLEEESEYNYDAELNIDYSIKFYLNAGADKDKLVLGIPTYGRSYTLINEESTEIGSPAEAPGEQGDATREKGYLAYYEICQNLKEDPEWTVVQPNPNAMGPYAYRHTQWVGYDDEAIVRKKAQYVVDNGLGGIMFWAIDNDDFRGTCTGKPYPLIEAAKDAMLEALGLGINEVSKPSAPQKPLRSRSRENSSSTRNRITTSEHKLTYAERKGSNKRTQTTQQNTRNTQQSTTNAPVSIKLTEAEGSSLYIGGRTTTPPPPTTPDPGTDFKCEDEGFFQHPRDCKKYYWCLDSGPSGLGIVAHQFTCPSGLYFNPAADSCDFARNVPCKIKKSTTAAPITTYSTSTTTTTPRPTQSGSRLTAATSRTSFFRTTSTTTTTEAPEEEEIEYEEDDEDNAASPFAKHKGPTDKEAEEDPQVIKELIELIRKVGGIEELEKHLLRKDDGTISIKENSSSSSSSSIAATTASPISKSLYEKVLSKPNALNSFRNRFTSTSSFRNTQTKTVIKTSQDDSEEEQQQSDKIDSKSSGASAGYSKYSSVVRGNSRQAPQSEGIEKSGEFDGLYKGKKQYTTINRGNKKASNVDEDEESVIAKSHIERDEQDEEEDDEDEVVVKTTKRPFSSNTPAYSTIRRTRPPTTTTETNEADLEEQDEKEVIDRKSYSSLNRSRGRGTTTTETPEVTEVTAGNTRYKYLERTRPTRPTTETSNKLSDEEDDDEESEDHENTVLLRDNENTRETQQEITTNTQRAYASIGRRTTTATPETETTIIAAKTTTTATPTTSTTETPITTPLTNLETTTPESIIITTNIPITTTTNPTTISTTPKTTSTRTTTLPNGEEVLYSLTTTPYPNEIDADSETLNLSHNINSLLTESASTTSSPTTESGLDTNKQEIDILETTTTTTTTETTASTTTEANDISPKTEDLEVKQQETNDEVTLVNKQRNKTLYTTRTRTTETPTTRTTTSNPDIETTSSPINNKKSFGVRRQQLLLNRSSQTKTTTTDIPVPTTESVNNDFLGTVSSPRPFGFPKRRTRPTTSASVSTTTIEEITKPNEESLVTKQKTTKLNAAVNNKTKVSSHNTILSQTASELETETSSQREHANKHNESEVAGTEHVNDKDIQVEQIKKHVVKQVNGFEGNTNNISKHVNTVVSYNNDNSAPKIKTQTIVEEVDDDDDNGPSKSYSWRDARRPTKPTPKKKKLVVTEVTTEERVRQRVSPDHVTIVNVVENNDKDVRFNKKEENTGKVSGKYRGKSLETSLEDDALHQDNQVDNEQADDEGRALRTYTTINRRRNQNEQSVQIGQDEESLNGFKVTQVVRSGGAEDNEEVIKSNHQYTSINRGQSAQEISSFINENGNDDVVTSKVKYTNLNRGHNGKPLDDSGNKNDQNSSQEYNVSQGSAKFKYTTITRGQATKTEGESESGTEIYKETTDANDHDQTQDLEKNDTELTTKFTYTKITRGQSTPGTVEERGSATDAKTLHRTSGFQQETDLETQENSRFGNTKTDTERKTYTTITRNRGLIQEKHESDNDSDRKENSKTIYVSNTENIPYKSIVRDSDGVHLTEGELSGFVKGSGVSTITTNTEKSTKTYQTISRGGQIYQSLDTEENDMKHSKMHDMEAMSLTHVEDEHNVANENFDKANATEDDADLTAEIEEVEDNIEKNSKTDIEISTTSSSRTTTEKPTLTTTESTTTTIEDSSSTEGITTESIVEFLTPEVVTNRILFRTRSSTTPSTTTTTPEPTTRRSLLRNRGSIATTNEEAKVEATTRRTFIRSRTTATKVDDESTTQTPSRRTVFRRRRPVSGVNEATVKEESQTLDSNSQAAVQSAGNTRTTSFRRRTILGRNPSTIDHALNEDSEAQSKSDSDSLIRTTSETTENDSKSISGQSLSRGSYRPTEKGDLSSLLALDLAKKYGNKSPQSFGNGRRRRPVERHSTEIKIAEAELNESSKLDKELSLTLEISSTQTQTKGDSESLTETTSTSNRGSYRPSEKGDLSSLLALDLAKKQGNKFQQTVGNGSRRKIIVKQIETDNQEETNGRNNVNGFTSSDRSSSITDSVGLNGRRKTIIRKRIQTNKSTQESTNIELGSNDSSNTDDLVQKVLVNESESTEKSATTLDNKLTNTHLTSLNSKFDNTNESSKKTENSLTTSDADLTKTGVVNATMTQENYLSYNLKHNTTSQQTLGNVKSNAFNSQNRKNFFGTKSTTENSLSHNLETDEDVNRTESNNSYSSESEKEQNSVNNHISAGSSGSKFQSRNTLNSQTQENSRTSSLYNRRGSFNTRLQGNHGKTEEIETLEDGTTRIKTTNVESINVGGTVKTIKRTKIKTILKQAPEYEYETIDYSGSSTTRRPINRHRGSARFESNDLSSLLALDFAAKSNRRVNGEVTGSKSRRKIIRKPDIVTETEQVEEYEEEYTTRAPRPSKSTTPAQEPIRRRTRPTRLLRTTTTTTRAPKTEEVEEAVEEKIVSTTRRNFAFKRPNSTTTTTTEAPATEKVVEDNEEHTTKRNIAFKRPTQKTNISTEEKLNKATTLQREKQNETVVQRTKLVNSFKLKQPTTTTESTSEQTDEPTTTPQTTPSTTSTTTEEIMNTTEEYIEPTADPSTTTSTNPATTSTSPAPTATTTESIVFTTESPSQLSTIQYEEVTTANVPTPDPLDILKKQFAHAVHNLKSETVEVQKDTQTESSGGLEITQISSNKDINLPIYHRRKYYQYYKDSPIVYVNPITVAPHTAPQTNVDIARQIHDVFNISNNHLIEPEVSAETDALLAIEQAQEINSELGNFLVNSPGSN